MRKEFGAALRELFTQRMADTLPLFTPVPLKSEYIGPGEKVFRWVPHEPFHAWVILVPDPKREMFCVEVAWSKKGRFPALSMRPSPQAPDGSERALEEYAVRLADLAGLRNPWWTIEPFRVGRSVEEHLKQLQESLKPLAPSAACAKVSPRVEDALSLLVSHGVPYLERAAGF